MFFLLLFKSIIRLYAFREFLPFHGSTEKRSGGNFIKTKVSNNNFVCNFILSEKNINI